MSNARDLRDPQRLGETLLELREAWANKKAPFTEIADWMGRQITVPDYPQDELLSTVTQREYREELQQAAKEGDKYADERLRELT
jgi:hypothetical protein